MALSKQAAIMRLGNWLAWYPSSSCSRLERNRQTLGQAMDMACEVGVPWRSALRAPILLGLVAARAA
eukprot:4914005-Prorocentrum_lima.AAC.1